VDWTSIFGKKFVDDSDGSDEEEGEEYKKSGGRLNSGDLCMLGPVTGPEARSAINADKERRAEIAKEKERKREDTAQKKEEALNKLKANSSQAIRKFAMAKGDANKLTVEDIKALLVSLGHSGSWKGVKQVGVELAHAVFKKAYPPEAAAPTAVTVSG
jgi:hypothetical protein